MSGDPHYANSASNRADLSLGDQRLRRFHPEACGISGLLWSVRKRVKVRWFLAECLKYGDARAAVVWSRRPLLVAVYSDEFDAILMLRFPTRVEEELRFDEGQRLLGVNAYARGTGIAPDIRVGQHASFNGPWTNFVPIVAEVFSDDQDRVRMLHRTIPEPEWARCGDLAAEHAEAFPGRSRNGLPLFAGRAEL